MYCIEICVSIKKRNGIIFYNIYNSKYTYSIKNIYVRRIWNIENILRFSTNYDLRQVSAESVCDILIKTKYRVSSYNPLIKIFTGKEALYGEGSGEIKIGMSKSLNFTTKYLISYIVKLLCFGIDMINQILSITNSFINHYIFGLQWFMIEFI